MIFINEDFLGKRTRIFKDQIIDFFKEDLSSGPRFLKEISQGLFKIGACFIRRIFKDTYMNV